MKEIRIYIIESILLAVEIIIKGIFISLTPRRANVLREKNNLELITVKIYKTDYG